MADLELLGASDSQLPVIKQYIQVRKLAANREFDSPAAPMSLTPRLLPLHWGLAKIQDVAKHAQQESTCVRRMSQSSC